jgi:hypothetical protein
LVGPTTPSASQHEPQRRYSFPVKCLAVCASILFTLCFLEIGLRVIFAIRKLDIHHYQPSFVYAQSDSTSSDRSRFTAHPFLPYAPRPFDARKLYVYRDGIQQIVEYDITNNSLGFRTPERPFDKPSNTKRIITLGGSTTWEGPTNDQTWPALLEKKLNSHYEQTGSHVEVINLGVDMASSPMSLIELAFIGLEFHPDLVISYDGVNDSLLMGLQGETSDYRSTIARYDERLRTLQSRLPAWAFKSYLASIASQKYDLLFSARADLYSQVIANQTSALKPSQNPVEGIEYFERNLSLMRAISQDQGAKFIAATAHWNQPSPKIVLMNSELRDFFQRSRMDYLDLETLLPHDDWSIHSDPVHWTRKGLDDVAEQWQMKIISSDLLGLNH